MNRVCKIVLLIILYILSNEHIHSQPKDTLNIWVISGWNVDFVFNSIDKYETGTINLPLSNWTTIRVDYIDDNNDDPDGWTLSCQTFNYTDFNDTLGLESVTINASGPHVTNSSFNLLSTKDTWYEIASDNATSGSETFEINLSYSFDKTGGLLNTAPGIYRVDFWIRAFVD